MTAGGSGLTAAEAALVARYDADLAPPDDYARRLDDALATGGSVVVPDRAAFALLRERAGAAGLRLVDGAYGAGAGGWAFADPERGEVVALLAHRVVDGRVMVTFHDTTDPGRAIPAWVAARLDPG